MTMRRVHNLRSINRSIMTMSLKSVTRVHKMGDQAIQLQIYALGPSEVCLGEYLVTFPTRKTLALLIFLTLESVAEPPEALADILWPEASPERHHASLRNTLDHLQTSLRQASSQAKLPIFQSHIIH